MSMRTNEAIKMDATRARNACIKAAEKLCNAVEAAEAAEAEGKPSKAARNRAIKAAERVDVMSEAAKAAEAEAAEVARIEAEAEALKAAKAAEAEAAEAAKAAEVTEKLSREKLQNAIDAMRAAESQSVSDMGAHIMPNWRGDLISVIDDAAETCGVFDMTEAAECGGARIDVAIIVSARIGGKMQSVWAHELPIHASRIAPAEFFGGTVEAAPDWYVRADAKKVKDGTQKAVVSYRNGKPYNTEYKADKEGKPIAIKMSLRKYFNEHIHDVMQAAIYRAEHEDDVNWLSHALASKQYAVELKPILTVR